MFQDAFVMSDADVQEALAEREAYSAWMDMRDSYADYVEAQAEDLAEEEGWEEDDWDVTPADTRVHDAPYLADPEPPTPASPAFSLPSKTPAWASMLAYSKE